MQHTVEDVQRARVGIVGIDGDSRGGAAHKHILQFIIGARRGEIDATPLSRHEVVVSAVEKVVGSVAAQVNGAVTAAGGYESAFDFHSSLVVEMQRGARLDGECGTRGHEKRVENHIRLLGRESGIFGEHRARESSHILPPSGENHLLSNAVGDEIDVIGHLKRRVLIGGVDEAFHEDVNAILATDFHIVKFRALHAIYIQEKPPVSVALQRDGRDVDHLLMSIVDNELLGRRAEFGKNGVESHSVARKLEQIGARRRKTVLDATGGAH